MMKRMRWYNPDMPSRSRVYRTEAVILRRMNLGEADRILTAITPDQGKLRMIAKGVRKPGSRKAGHLEPFTRAQLLLARGRDLDIVTQVEALETFPGLRDDLMRIGRAAYVAELIDRFAVEEEGSRDLYRLLLKTYERLCSSDNPAAVLRFFQVHLLSNAGFGPELSHCLKCGKPIEAEDQFFSIGEGGVFCPNCGAMHATEVQPITLNSLKMLRHYQRSTYDQVKDTLIRDRVQKEVDGLLETYLQHILERSLNAAIFLRRVERMQRDYQPPQD